MQGKDCKMKMQDMGTMSDMRGAEVSTSDKNKKEKSYPTTYLSSEKLSGIEDYDIGDECKLCSVNKVIGKREKQDGSVEVEVEILKIGIMDGKIDKSEYDNMSSEEKDKMDAKEVMGEDE